MRMLSVILLLATAASASPRVGALDFSVVKMKKQLGPFYSEHYAIKLGEQGIEVTTPKDIAAILSVERQRQLLGCADDRASCAVELAGALGVEAIISGEIAKVGKSFQVNVKVLSAKTAKPLHVYSKLVRKQEAILDALEQAAGRAGEKLRGEFGGEAPAPKPAVAAKPADTTKSTAPTVAPPVTTAAATATKPTEAPPMDVVDLPPPPSIKKRRRSSRAVFWEPWVPIGAGVVGLGVGALFLLNANTAWAQVTGAPAVGQTPSSVASLAREGDSSRTIGVVAASLGLAAVAGGITWMMLGDEYALFSAAPTSDGAFFVFSGRW